MAISVQEANQKLMNINLVNDFELQQKVAELEKRIDYQINVNLNQKQIIVSVKDVHPIVLQKVIDLYNGIGWAVEYIAERCPNGKKELILSGHYPQEL